MTTTDRIEDIKDRIEAAKSKKAKAEGAIERIETEWESNYGIKDGDTKAVEASLAELDTTITRDEKRLGELLEELETLTDWEE